MVWNHKHTQVNAVVISTRQHLKQWKEAQLWTSNALFHFRIQGDGAEEWVKPLNGIIKVTADATTFSEHNAYGFGLIARNIDLIQAKSGSKRGNVSGNYAEAVAIKEALSWIKVKGWSQVQLKSDSLVIIQAIRSKVCMVSIQDCRDL